MTVDRTQDYALIREILTQPEIYNRNLGKCPKEEYQPPHGDHFYYLLVREGRAPLGLFVFEEKQDGLQGHICLLPACFGRRSRRAGLLAMRWLWANTKADRVFGEVTNSRTLARRLSQDCGFAATATNDGFNLECVRPVNSHV